MTTKTIGALLAVVACGATLTIAGCESRSTAPENDPQTTTGRSKSPNVLTTCASIFTGIEHCTIGSTDLVANAAARTVRVTGFNAEGTNGVSSSFPDATEWSQNSIASFGTRTNPSIHLAAISDGEAVSKLDITRVDATTFKFTPTFTAADGASSRYHIHVFSNGVLQGGQEGIDPDITFVVGSGDDDRDGGDKHQRRRKFINSRVSNPNQPWQLPGACQWSQAALKPGVTFPVQLPNGITVVGNEVVITEEVSEGQAVYNDFQRINVTGNLESYTITGESTEPVE